MSRLARKPHFRAGIVKARLKCVAVEIAGALVEQAGHQVDETFLADGILRFAAIKSEAQRDDRNRIVLDQPGGDAACPSLNFLNFHRCLRAEC